MDHLGHRKNIFVSKNISNFYKTSPLQQSDVLVFLLTCGHGVQLNGHVEAAARHPGRGCGARAHLQPSHRQRVTRPRVARLNLARRVVLVRRSNIFSPQRPNIFSPQSPDILSLQRPNIFSPEHPNIFPAHLSEAGLLPARQVPPGDAGDQGPHQHLQSEERSHKRFAIMWSDHWSHV